MVVPQSGNILHSANRRWTNNTPCPHAKIPPEMRTIDADGDMLLLVGKQKCIDMSCDASRRILQHAACFHVNSAVVAGASPSFGLALYSPSAQSVAGDEVRWTVTLPDEDPLAMETVLQILYGYYPARPRDVHMSLKRLLHLTALAERYDLVHLFARWSPQWVEDMRYYWAGRPFAGMSTEVLESLLWIFWVLGHEPLYTYMVLQIAFHSELDAAGRLTDPTGQLCFTSESRRVFVPPCAPIEIGHTRIEILKKIHRIVKRTLEEHLHGIPATGRPRCGRMDGQDDSDWRRLVFQSFVLMLKAEGLWPLPSAYALTASPSNMVGLFHANPNIPWFVHHHNNAFCDGRGALWECLDKLLFEIRYAIPGPTIRSLRDHAVKSGLARYFEMLGDGVELHRGHWSLKEILSLVMAHDAVIRTWGVPSQDLQPQ